MLCTCTHAYYNLTSCIRHGVRSEVIWQRLSAEGEERQISTLLYCLGEEADDVLTSTNISDESRKKYMEVLAKFDAYFKVHKNVIFECARFNHQDQQEEKSVKQFITSLYSLSENCQYGKLKEEMIRDREVVSIRDSVLSERLQMNETLTLDKAKKLVQQREAVKERLRKPAKTRGRNLYGLCPKPRGVARPYLMVGHTNLYNESLAT